jgi:hypothetical protein
LEIITQKLNKSISRIKRFRRSCKSYEHNLQLRKIPEGGLITLQHTVKNDTEYMMNLSQNEIITKESYNIYMEWFFSTMYVLNVNGRRSGNMYSKLHIII